MTDNPGPWTIYAPPTTAVLLDFFGTLVDYSPSRTDQGYPRTHGLLERWGSSLTYAGFLDTWTAVAAGFDAASDVDDHEFSMDELCRAFLAHELAEPPANWQVDGLVATFSPAPSRRSSPASRSAGASPIPRSTGSRSMRSQ